MKKNQTTSSILELENTILEGLDKSLEHQDAHSKDENQKNKDMTHLIDEAVGELSVFGESSQKQKKSEDSKKLKKNSERKEAPISISGSKTKDKSNLDQNIIYHSDHNQLDLKKSIPESISKDSFVLTLSNHVKIAEKKIKELESDNNQLRLNSNKLLFAGETLQSSYDQLFNEYHTMKENYDEDRSSLLDQKKALDQGMSVQSAEIRNLKMKISTLEKHLNRDVQKIRIRERDLENRLQFKQKELDTIIREKDEDLLSMKREVDRLREQLQETQDQTEKWMHQQSLNKDKSQRVTRALQMSLHLLEGDKEVSTFEPSQKAVQKFSAPEDEAHDQAYSSQQEGSESKSNNLILDPEQKEYSTEEEQNNEEKEEAI